MKRSLTAFDLTCLGIGAIIGTGIFALAGTAAAGEAIHSGGSIMKTPVLNFLISWVNHTDLVFGRPAAGPAVALSFIVAAIACGFAALCYSELAAMIPVSGSAYTYSYATLGEIIAWIIGWDLILEYAVGNMAVAVGWSGYFVQLMGNLPFGLHLKFPLWLMCDHTTALTVLAKGGAALSDYSSTTLPVIAGYQIAFDLPAFLIVAAVTVLLIFGIRESATANTTIVIIKLAVVVFVIAFGSFLVNPTNWHPFMPSGFGGVMGGAAIVFFAFIGFDAISTTAEETKNPRRDLPIGMIASLVICTLLYVMMSLVLTGMKKYTTFLGDSAAVATAFAAKPWAQALISAGALAGLDLGPARFPARPAAHLHGDGARWPAASLLRENPSALPHALCHDHPHWHCRRWSSHAHRYRFARGPDEYRNALRLRPRVSRRDRSAAKRSEPAAAFSCAVRPALPHSRRALLRGAHAQSAD